MKKLMIAAAASMAAVSAFAAVESANIVGYQNEGLAVNGQMKAAPFVTVGEGGVYLSDLSVSGDAIESEGGCWGGVSIAMLTGSGYNQKVGSINRTYYWFEEEGAYEAGWYDVGENPLANDESTLGNADEIYFEQGEALWINVDSEYAGCTINFKGEVTPASFAYTLVANGQMVGNPHPVNVYLSDITVTGDAIESEGGCWGGVSIAMLTGSGYNQKVGSINRTYYWFEEEGAYEAGWYDVGENPLANDESTLGNADEIYFTSGQGIWVNVDSEYAGCTINFPALQLN